MGRARDARPRHVRRTARVGALSRGVQRSDPDALRAARCRAGRCACSGRWCGATPGIATRGGTVAILIDRPGAWRLATMPVGSRVSAPAQYRGAPAVAAEGPGLPRGHLLGGGRVERVSPIGFSPSGRPHRPRGRDRTPAARLPRRTALRHWSSTDARARTRRTSAHWPPPPAWRRPGLHGRHGRAVGRAISRSPELDGRGPPRCQPRRSRRRPSSRTPTVNDCPPPPGRPRARRRDSRHQRRIPRAADVHRRTRSRAPAVYRSRSPRTSGAHGG